MKNMIGIGTNLYSGNAVHVFSNVKGTKRNDLSIFVSFDRLVGSFSGIGIFAIRNNYAVRVDKRFYYAEGYKMEVEGKAVPVDEVYGKLTVSESTGFLDLKCYYSKRRPLGFFSSWKLGLSHYNVRMDDQLRFKSNYNNGNYREYKAEPAVLKFKHLLWSWGAGYSTRLWHDRLLFTTVLSLPVPVRISRHPDILSRYLVNHANQFMINYKFMNLSLGINYVF